MLLLLIACAPELVPLVSVADSGSIWDLTVDETGAPVGFLGGRDDGMDDFTFRWDGETLRTDIDGWLVPGAGGDVWVRRDDDTYARLVAGEPQAPIEPPSDFSLVGVPYGGGGDTLYSIANAWDALAVYRDGGWSLASLEGDVSWISLLAASPAGVAVQIGGDRVVWVGSDGVGTELIDGIGVARVAISRGQDVLAIFEPESWRPGSPTLWRLGPDGAEPLVSVGSTTALAASDDEVWVAIPAGGPNEGLYVWRGLQLEKIDLPFWPEDPRMAATPRGTLYVAQGGELSNRVLMELR